MVLQLLGGLGVQHGVGLASLACLLLKVREVVGVKCLGSRLGPSFGMVLLLRVDIDQLLIRVVLVNFAHHVAMCIHFSANAAFQRVAKGIGLLQP